MQALGATTSSAPLAGSIRMQAVAVLLGLSEGLWTRSTDLLRDRLPPAPTLDEDAGDDDAHPHDLLDDAVSEIDTSFERYLSHVRLAPRLEPEQERALFLQMRSGNQAQRDHARHALVQAHLWLVPIIVRRFNRRGSGFEDLIAEGNLGLYDAIDRFDVERGLRFSSYAKWWVVHAVTSAMAANAYPVRLPRRVAQALSRKRREQAGPATAMAPMPAADSRDAEIEPADDSKEQCGAAPRQVPMTVDWSSAARDDEAAHPHTSAEAQPDNIVALRQLLHLLADSVKELPGRERRVIEMRYGLNGQKEATLQQIGDAMGLSAERVRTLQIGATELLKNKLTTVIAR
jgi:RNA polymerase sigma factor (sigma-70 family)